MGLWHDKLGLWVSPYYIDELAWARLRLYDNTAGALKVGFSARIGGHIDLPAYLSEGASLFSHYSLHPLLLKALKNQGLTRPTPVQEATIPLAMDYVDLQVNAETGTGKTLAYLVPMIQHMLSCANPGDGTRALVLVPTRELGQQVAKVAEALTKLTRLSVVMISGGEPIKAQREALMEGADIVVATTGRLLEHVEKGTVDFETLEMLVLDEADRMLDMGFSDEVLQIAAACNEQRQTLLFSATLNNKWLPSIAAKVLREPETVDASMMAAQLPPIREQLVLSDENEHKQKQVLWLLENETYDKALVFTNSRTQADKLASILVQNQQRVSVLHGEMDPSKRKRVMEWVHEGRIQILIATELAARGLDIDGIDLVVNFELPRRGDLYIHRIGRTGRAGKEGLAVSLVNSNEWNTAEGIQRYLKREFEPRILPGLDARFSGVVKARGMKKKEKKKAKAPKVKVRLRDKKNVGKRRAPATKKDKPSDSNS